jgi:hypothetical protein
MGFLKKMRKAAHKVEAAVERAADTATHPTELRDLDAIVKDLTTQLDVAILQFENDGTPPNADQAKEWCVYPIHPILTHQPRSFVALLLITLHFTLTTFLYEQPPISPPTSTQLHHFTTTNQSQGRRSVC